MLVNILCDLLIGKTTWMIVTTTKVLLRNLTSADFERFLRLSMRFHLQQKLAMFSSALCC